MQTIFIHGAGLVPDTSHPATYPLLAHLLKLCPDLLAPTMPDALDPTPEGWMRGIDGALSSLTEDSILIGHSLGGSMILKWLSEGRPGFRARSFLALAAPFWGMPGWDYDGFRLPEGFAKAASGIDRIILCHAADDSVVAPTHLDRYAAELPSATRILLPDGGHSFEADGILPVLRAAIAKE